MISLFIVLIILLVGSITCLYWQNSLGKTLSQNNDKQTTELIKSLRTSVETKKINDPTNSTLDNAKIESIVPSESKISVLDKNGSHVDLKVMSDSRIQTAILSESGKVSRWQDVNISAVQSNKNAVVVHNKNKEIVYLAFVSN
jgi:hypothetical protein